MKRDFKIWAKAAVIRAIKTVAQAGGACTEFATTQTPSVLRCALRRMLGAGCM